MVDFLLWNWFLVDTTFILLESEEEEEGVAKSMSKT